MSSRKITTLKRLAGLEGNSKVQADACWRLAGAYHSGNGVAKDAKEEMRWLMRASELGHAEAQFNLGCCYNNGQGVVQSYEKDIDVNAMPMVQCTCRAARVRLHRLHFARAL